METVTISKGEYEDLLRCYYWSIALEDVGLDNWGGIDYAQKFYVELCEKNDLKPH